jgi:hypothetical protein
MIDLDLRSIKRRCGVAEYASLTMRWYGAEETN